MQMPTGARPYRLQGQGRRPALAEDMKRLEVVRDVIGGDKG
jgi:hypothetical protein